MRIIYKNQNHFIYRILSTFIAFTFIFTTLTPPNGYAQTIPTSVLNLPVPGMMVNVTSGYTPALVRGITIHPEDPLKFNFIIDKGDENISGDELKEKGTTLIKYFLAALTTPEKEMWVNLSPYEQDRIIANGFGETEMGRDMLAQDYMLKQLTASLMYPEKELGDTFWKAIYAKAQEQFGTIEIPVNTFNKVWIVPQKAVVFEHEQTAYVIESKLKVMLEEDYLAMTENNVNTHDISSVQTEIIKEIIIPAITQEVNEGKTFANLRQIYNSMILAEWYKQNLKQSLLGQVYVDQNKTKGIDTEDKDINQKIYNQYVESFKKGVYNYIREDYDEATQELIPRKYFSGGATMDISSIFKNPKEMKALTVNQFIQFSKGLSSNKLSKHSALTIADKIKSFFSEDQAKIQQALTEQNTDEFDESIVAMVVALIENVATDDNYALAASSLQMTAEQKSAFENIDTVLHVSPEMDGYSAKVGGLADVVGALPKIFTKLGRQLGKNNVVVTFGYPVGEVTKEKLLQQFNNGEAIWNQLLETGWISAKGKLLAFPDSLTTLGDGFQEQIQDIREFLQEIESQYFKDNNIKKLDQKISITFGEGDQKRIEEFTVLERVETYQGKTFRVLQLQHAIYTRTPYIKFISKDREFERKKFINTGLEEQLNKMLEKGWFKNIDSEKIQLAQEIDERILKEIELLFIDNNNLEDLKHISNKVLSILQEPKDTKIEYEALKNLGLIEPLTEETPDSIHDYMQPIAFGQTVALSQGALRLDQKLGINANLVHGHDWQAGLLPAYMRHHVDFKEEYNNVAHIETIHNLAYQGIFNSSFWKYTGLSSDVFNQGAYRMHGDLNLMKGAIELADIVNTVSPQYAQEITTKKFGEGLEKILARTASEGRLRGILNGIDPEEWNPRTDKFLRARNLNFGLRKVKGKQNGLKEGKAAVKKELQNIFGLSQQTDVPLFGIVGRAVEQKGFDYVVRVIKRLMEDDENVQIVMLGTGDKLIENDLESLAKLYPNNVSVKLEFNNELAHMVEAGSDAFWMFSRFEPSGLNQFYSLAYGTIPIVTPVGGLLNSIKDGVTGFVAKSVSFDDILEAVQRALQTYRDTPKDWNQMQRTAIKEDFSWKAKAAKEYVAMYADAIIRRQAANDDTYDQRKSASPLEVIKERQAGILLHPTSLPSRDFGSDAYKFVDKLHEAGIRVWQTLPLTPTNNPFDAPYSSISAFGISEFLISLEKLLEKKLLNEITTENKESQLKLAYHNFQSQENLQRDFEDFVTQNAWWLDDFALFKAIKDNFEGAFWKDWDEGYKEADEETLNNFQQNEKNKDNINFIKFKQYLAFQHWMDLKAYANAKGIDIFGDMPIFVAEDSVEAWKKPQMFKKGVVAGVPPDYFSETGQRWGNPLYDWEYQTSTNFEWWKQRFGYHREIFDLVRIDHFRGFEAYWEIPEKEKTAIKGRWVNDVPKNFFDAMIEEFGELPVIAEDLGTITPEVAALKNRFGFPGMKILQFAFGGDDTNPYLPHNIEPDSVVYTGTHDNDTTKGWWITATDAIKTHVKKYLNLDGRNIVNGLTQKALQSAAVLAMIPWQDLFKLGSETRTNIPGEVNETNWRSQMTQEQLDTFDAKKLRLKLEKTGRAPQESILSKVNKINQSERYQVNIKSGEEGQDQYHLIDKKNNASYMVDMKGFNIRSFQINGNQEILHENGIPVGYPWQGRIADGSFEWNGSHDLNGVDGVNFHEKHAIHGMVQDIIWSLEDIGIDENGIFIKASIDSKDYPTIEEHFGKSKLTLVYRLEENKLILDHIIENKDTKDIPVSIGYHPWIKADKNKMTIQGDPVQQYKLESMIPTQVDFIMGGAEFDLSESKGMTDIPLDDVFQGMSVDADGFWAYTLNDQANARTIEIRAEADSFPVAVLWNGWGDSVSVEPQEHAPNAINAGMNLLKAGATRKGRFVIQVTQASSSIPGGIDFNSELLDLQIKRNASSGIALPLSEQPLDTMRIDGFVPFILEILPITPIINMLPMLGLLDEEESNDLSYHFSIMPMDKRNVYI